MSSSLLELRDVVRSFGVVKALDGISFNIEKGERVALIGSNGAGKSTLMEIISGQLSPSRGLVTIDGIEPSDPTIRNVMRSLPQEMDFPSQLKVQEILTLVAAHYNNANFDALTKDLELKPLLNRRVSRLSGGQRRRVALAATLIGSPTFLMLDEPTANIDFEGRHLIYKVLRKYLGKSHKGLLFSSHHMNEVEELATRIILINSGRVVADGSTAEMKSRFGLKAVHFHSLNPHKDWVKGVTIQKVAGDNRYMLVGSDSDKMLRDLLSNDPTAKDIEVSQSSLEDIFKNVIESNNHQGVIQ